MLVCVQHGSELQSTSDARWLVCVDYGHDVDAGLGYAVDQYEDEDEPHPVGSCGDYTCCQP